MSTTALSVYRELEQLDVAHDLVGRALHVTSDGIAWQSLRPSSMATTKIIDLYYYMALTRAVDHEIVKFVRKGLAFGKHLMCTGNEATSVGASYALQKEDWATLAIRDLGVYLVRGVPISNILAQACGRVTGLTGGWDGSLHMGSKSARIVGLVSHLGTLAPVATGCAFAQKMHETEGAALTFVGEGATSTGDVHEALNIASVLRLPLVVVIENNQWAFGTPARLQYAVPTLALRALAYGSAVEGVLIDGTDVLAVYQTVHAALERARERQTITIIEATSMRLQGHSLADPFTTYVPPEQLASWTKKDPITSFRQRLIDENWTRTEDLQRIDRQIVDEVTAAALEAEQGAIPTSEGLESRVFAPSNMSNLASDEFPTKGTRMTYRQAIQDALREEMDRDPSIFMIGQDIGISNGAFKITNGFSTRYDGIDWSDVWNKEEPIVQRRVIDAPLAEAGFTGLALGAALCGLRPIVEFEYADFSSEAFKMIVNYAATETVRGMGPLPAVFRLPSGWAPNTSIYHSVNPESWFASTPGLKIVAPISAFDAKGLLKAAIRDDNPVLYLEYKGYYRIPPEEVPPELNHPVPDEDYVIPIGKARILKEGSDLSLITYGSQVFRALEAARQVTKEDGVSIEVIDLRTLVPYDTQCIQKSVRKTGRALVTCEAPRTGCFGNTVVTEIIRSSFEYLEAPVRLVAAADTPVPFAPSLEAAHLPTAEKIVAALHEVIEY